MQKENRRMFNFGLNPPKFQMRKRNSRFGVALMTVLSICMSVIFVSHLDAQEIIDPHSGLMVSTTTDLIVDAGAINLEVQRSLQLRRSYKGMLGAGWQMNWETRLYPMADFVLIEENGLLTRFDPEAGPDRYAHSGEDLIFDVSRRATRHKTDGTREIFDPQGRLIERDPGNGNKVFLGYDDAGRLARIDGPKGSFLQFGLDAGGHVTRIDSSRDRTIKYGYTDGRLTEVEVNKGYVIRYTYSPNGDLIKIDDPQTGAVEFAYDAKGRVISRRWADGSQERYEFDDEKNIRRHIDAGGNVTTSRWSDNNRRVEITDALGNQNTMEYDGAGQMTQISGPTGVIAQMTYDARGRIATVKDSREQTTQFEYVKESALVKRITRPDCTAQVFEYDQNRNLTRVKTGATTVSELSYHPDGLLAGIREAGSHEMNFAYFPDGNLKSIRNALGETTRFEYDARGNLIREINPFGGETLWKYDTEDQLVSETDSVGGTTRFEYDAWSRLSRFADPMGGMTRYNYDERGRLVDEIDPLNRVTRYQYHSDGRLKSIIDPAGNKTLFEYDPAGNLLREINPMGGVTTRMYDALGRLTKESNPAGVTTSYEFSLDGKETVQVDATGAAMQMQYDNCGRLVKETDPAGRVTRYDYTPEGQMARIISPSGLRLAFDHDEAGNLTALTQGSIRLISYGYDTLGRLVKEKHASGREESYRYDAMKNMIAWKDNWGSGTAEYNTSGQPTVITDSLGATYRYRYDLAGNLLEMTDPLGNTQRWSYDAAGQLIQVMEPSGDQTRYQYDPAGNLTRVVRPGGGVNTYEYDPLGNPIGFTNPLSKKARSTYDAAGRLLNTTDPKGQTTTFTYDQAGRLLEKRLADGKVVRYTYNVLGILTEVDDEVFPVRYTYDESGNLVKIDYPAIKRNLNYEYDKAGRLVKFIDSEARPITYRYDTINRLKAIQVGEGKEINITYDANDRPRSMVFPNGVRGRWEYDSKGQPVKITYAPKTAKTMAEWSYTYNDGGNLVKAINAEGRTLKYRYDPSGQLIEEAAGDNRITTYGYSPGGNRGFRRTASGSTEYHYDKADRLLKAGEETFKYDANGNLIERHGPRGIIRYTYDTEDQLINVYLPDGSKVGYGYAPTGERIWRRDAKGMIYFVTDGFNVLAELDEDLQLKASYLHGPGIDNPLMMIQGSRAFYFHANRMGSIIRVTDQEGRIAASYEYDAFGRIASQTGSLANPFTYTAREFDTATGLYYYRARYYDPELGRFLTTDPVPADVDRPLEQNPYLYVRNGPTRFTDPLGLQTNPSSDSGFVWWLENWVKEGVSKTEVLRYLRQIKHTCPQFAKKWTNIITSSNTGTLEKYLTRVKLKQPEILQNWISNPSGAGASIPKFQGPTGTVLLPGNTAPGPGSTAIIPVPTMSPSPSSLAKQGKPWRFPIPGPKGKGFVPNQRSFSQALRQAARASSLQPPQSSIIGGATRPINPGAGPPPGNTVALRPGLSTAAKAGLGTLSLATIAGNVAACLIEGGGWEYCAGATGVTLIGSYVGGKILVAASPTLATAAASPPGVIVLGGIGAIMTGYRIKKALEGQAQRQKEIKEFEENRNRYCMAKIKEPEERITELFNASSKMPRIFETMEAPKAARAQFASLVDSKQQANSRLGQLKTLLALIRQTARKCDQLQNQIMTARDKTIDAKNQAARHQENAFEAASTCQNKEDAEKIVQEYNQARSKIYESEDHARSIKEPFEEMQSQSEVITQATENAREAIDDISEILSSKKAQYTTVFEKVKAAKDEWAELESVITREHAAIESLINTRLAYCFDDTDARVEFEALKIKLKAAAQIDNTAINSISGMLPEAEKLTSDLGNLRQKNNAIGRDFTTGTSSCDLSESFVQTVAQIPKPTREHLASMVPFLSQKKEECSSPSEEEGETQAETEGDPTEDDEWAKGGGQRTRRSSTIASTSGGQRTGRYSGKTLGAAENEPLKSSRRKSGSSSQGSTPTVATSSTSSPATTQPTSSPTPAEPTPPATSPAKEPGETEESACPPPSLTNTDWTLAYGDIFFFIMQESSSCELIGCIRQRGSGMGICDEKIGTRSGKQVTMEKASYLGGAIWNLQLSSDGEEMNGTQTTKEYGTRNVRFLRD